jgi:hypothetical protein
MDSTQRTQTTQGLIVGLLSVCSVVLACLGTAQAGSGGVDLQTSGKCGHVRFGSRVLARGDCGSDVGILNALLRSVSRADVNLSRQYGKPTAGAVRSFERTSGEDVNGVVEKSTRRALTKRVPTSRASWYGGPLNGRQTACGETLRRRTIGVANKHLPCGTTVVFGYRGHWVRAKVIDRGPYVPHTRWDLTQATADRLHFTSVGVDDVHAAVLHR